MTVDAIALKYPKILVAPDPILTQEAVPIEEFDQSVLDLCEAMKRHCKRVRAHGVAAPQIGASLRAFVWREPKTGIHDFVINPTVVQASGAWGFKESCLSLPGFRFWIERPNRIEIEGFNELGERVHRDVSELGGRILQHELDHLDGILMLPDRVREQLGKSNRPMRREGERYLKKFAEKGPRA